MGYLHYKLFDFSWILKKKIFDKIFEFNFFNPSPWGGGYENWSNLKFVVEPNCKTWILKHIKIRLNPKDELSIWKFEQVMAISVSKG